MNAKALYTRPLDDFIGQDGPPVFVMDTLVQGPVGKHDHSFTEIVVVFSGEGRHREGGDTWDLSRGDVFTVPVGRSHSYYDVHELHLVNILVDLEQLRSSLAALREAPGFRALLSLEPAARARTGRNCRLRLTNRELGHARALIAAMGEEQDGASSGYQAMVVGLFLQLLTLLVRSYGRSPGQRPRALVRISDLLGHLDAHYAEPTTLAAMAQRAGMSSRSLTRIFRDLLDNSPTQYLLELRLAKACDLLRTRPELNVTEIGLMVGFNDGAYFSRRLSRHMGLPPLCWRKENQI